VHGADNLTTFMCQLPWNLGTSTSWNPQGLSTPVMALLNELCKLWYETMFCECRNFGRVERRTSWQETKKIWIKMAMTCNMNVLYNRMQKIMQNYRPDGWNRLGRPFERLLDEAETGLSRPNLWQMMMTDV